MQRLSVLGLAHKPVSLLYNNKPQPQPQRPVAALVAAPAPKPAPAPAPAPAPKPARVTKKAFLVGINYIGTPNELSGCINDVMSMRDLLKTKFGYTSFEIQTDNLPIRPTKTNILAGLNRLISGSVAGDTLFFHYSGHGTLVPDRNSDEPTRLDSAIVPLDFLAKGTILDDDLRAIFCKAPAGVQIFCLVDACHSGTAFDLRYQYTDDSYETVLKQTLTEYKQYPKTPANIMMMSACLDSQYAADTFENNKNCGALTWAFLDVAKPGIKFKYLLKDVNTKLKSSGYSQRPQLSCGNATNAETLLNF